MADDFRRTLLGLLATPEDHYKQYAELALKQGQQPLTPEQYEKMRRQQQVTQTVGIRG